MTTDSLCFKHAVELIALLQRREISALDVMREHLARIEEINPKINAICTLLDPDECLAMARESDAQRASDSAIGPLHGLPIACKDLANTRGIRTTLGSLVMKDNIPDTDSLFVERLRKAGALIIGKTNTPEFGAGSNTFNAVFGATRNPWDIGKTAGGSSGGAAAALAARLLPLADGSDMGGSLRNPAAYCNVFGLRPSIGRIPMLQAAPTWQGRLGVEGPMARSVDDLGLLLSVMAGHDARDPLSIDDNPEQYARITPKDFSGTRIGWTPDLGFLPVEKVIADNCAGVAQVFAELGCKVEQEAPDLRGAMDVFRVLRANIYAMLAGPLLERHRDVMKETLVQNTEIGLRLTAEDLARANEQRAYIYRGVMEFFERHDFLVLPSTQVVPFDVETEWVTEIEGRAMDDYLEWMTICCVITILDLPAVSVPCGFTDAGLPMGIQIVGKPRGEYEVLQLARAFEQLRPFARQTPPL